MMSSLRSHGLFIGLLTGLTAFQIWGATRVPFHPDEATYLYMSADFEPLLSNPEELAWKPGLESDPRQRYRMIDGSLPRYWLGLGRSIAGLPPVPADWDWSLSWAENQAQGALPAPALLSAGRLSITLLLPLSMLFLYLTGTSLSGRGAGLLAAMVFGTNSLVLVHGRRAMAEGLLILGVCMFLWSLRYRMSKPWLVGLAVALAINAKHSGLVLGPVGLIAVTWPDSQAQGGLKKLVRRLALFGGVIVAITWLLNPFLWKQPIQALQASLHLRESLLARQVADLQRLVPAQVLSSPGQRALGLVANLFILPPFFAEVGNYNPQIAAAASDYLAVPGHVWGRGISWGGIFLVISLFGLLASFSTHRGTADPVKTNIGLLAAACGSQLLAHVALVPLPWQRFVLVFIPYTARWAGIGLGALLQSAHREIYPRLWTRSPQPIDPP